MATEICHQFDMSNGRWNPQEISPNFLARFTLGIGQWWVVVSYCFASFYSHFSFIFFLIFLLLQTIFHRRLILLRRVCIVRSLCERKKIVEFLQRLCSKIHQFTKENGQKYHLKMSELSKSNSTHCIEWFKYVNDSHFASWIKCRLKKHHKIEFFVAKNMTWKNRNHSEDIFYACINQVSPHTAYLAILSFHFISITECLFKWKCFNSSLELTFIDFLSWKNKRRPIDVRK